MLSADENYDITEKVLKMLDEDENINMNRRDTSKQAVFGLGTATRSLTQVKD